MHNIHKYTDTQLNTMYLAAKAKQVNQNTFLSHLNNIFFLHCFGLENKISHKIKKFCF